MPIGAPYQSHSFCLSRPRDAAEQIQRRKEHRCGAALAPSSQPGEDLAGGGSVPPGTVVWGKSSCWELQPCSPHLPLPLPLTSHCSCLPSPLWGHSAGASFSFPSRLCRCRWRCGVTPLQSLLQTNPGHGPPRNPQNLQKLLQDPECPAGLALRATAAWAVPGFPDVPALF